MKSRMKEDIYKDFEDSKVLIVGGAGFVGSNLSKLLIKNVDHIKITIVDNLLSAEISNIPESSKIDFREGSVTDFRILAELNDEYDYIFHLATFHGNQSSIFDPIMDHDNNTLTTLKLYEVIKKFKRIKKVVYASAGCSVAKKTFDTAVATTEEDPIEINMDSPYSISKLIGEFYSNYYYKQYGIPIVRTRFQNVYGPGEILGAGNWRGTYATIWRNVTPIFIYKALKGMDIPLENEGIATRDFIYVEDICKGLLLSAIYGEKGDVYNLGTGKEISIAQLAETVKEITGSKSKINYLPKRNWDNSGKRFASIEKSKQKLGFVAEITWQEGISRTVEWTKDNLELIERCISKHMEHLDYYQKHKR